MLATQHKHINPPYKKNYLWIITTCNRWYNIGDNTIIGLYQCIHDNNNHNKPHINRVGIDVSYQQMKTDEITTPNYFIHGQTETPYHHTGETGTRQIISSYLNKQNDNGAY